MSAIANLDIVVDRIKQSLSLVDVVRSYVELKRQGPRWVALCPLGHSERNPSFGIPLGKDFFHCFSCSAGGDLFDFIKAIEGVDFIGAVKILAERAGIPLEGETDAAAAAKAREWRERTRKVEAWTAQTRCALHAARYGLADLGRWLRENRGDGDMEDFRLDLIRVLPGLIAEAEQRLRWWADADGRDLVDLYEACEKLKLEDPMPSWVYAAAQRWARRAKAQHGAAEYLPSWPRLHTFSLAWNVLGIVARECEPPAKPESCSALESTQRMFAADLTGLCRDFLAKRGLSDATIREFGIGYSNGREARLPDAVQAGLAIERDGKIHSRFAGRMTFPIHDGTGQLVGFGGRAMHQTEAAKYVNSPETDVYRKSELLYNLHRARPYIRRYGYAVLVEGYMDVIGLWERKIRNVVASCGTALTEPQVALLACETDCVVLLYDPDEAGARAAKRSIPLLLSEGIDAWVPALSDGLDPDEWVQKYGEDAFIECVDAAAHWNDWLAEVSE